MIHHSDDRVINSHNRRQSKKGKSEMITERNGSVQLHGFENLDDAMEMKKIVEEAGVKNPVIFHPEEFEFRVHKVGYQTYFFSIVVPCEIDKNVLRNFVTDAITCHPNLLDEKMMLIENDAQMCFIKDQLIYNIRQVRVLLDADADHDEAPTSTTFPPVEFFTSPSTSSKEKIMNQQINSTESKVNSTEESTTMSPAADEAVSTKTTKTTIESETTETVLKDGAVVSEARVVTVVPAAAMSFLARHKKKFVMGAAVVAAGAAVAVGYKNADKIMGLFNKTDVAA